MNTQSPADNIAGHFIDVPAARHGGRVAAVGPEGSVTYEALQSLTVQAAHTLRGLACRPGDRVVIAAPDGVEFMAAFFGAARLGALPVPVSAAAQPPDYAYYLSNSAAGFVVTHSSVLPRVTPAVNGSPVRIIIADREWEVSSAGSPGRARRGALDVPAHPTRTEDPAFILYTSGSTGHQKGVLHSHGNMMAASHLVGSGVFRLDQSDRVLALSKLSFAFGLGFGMYFPLSVGASVVIMRGPTTLEDIGRLIATYRPTVLAGVPSVLASLLHAARTWLSLDLSSVRFIASAGEPLSTRLFDAYRSSYGIEVVDGIGSTEMLTHFISNSPGHSRRDCCGREVPGYQVRLVDESGQSVADGEIGSLQVKGPSAFIRYQNRPAHGVVDWVVTGDRLYRDADGYYHYCGRTDDMIKVAGLWASPRDIEGALHQHASVERAVVTTREDDRGHRRVVAYLVLRRAAAVPAAQLLRHVADLVPEHMIPSALVFLPEFPLTATGKINRAALPAPQWRHG